MNNRSTTIQQGKSEDVIGGSQESTSKRRKPQIIHNCKKDINLLIFQPNIEEVFIFLQYNNDMISKVSRRTIIRVWDF